MKHAIDGAMIDERHFVTLRSRWGRTYKLAPAGESERYALWRTVRRGHGGWRHEPVRVVAIYPDWQTACRCATDLLDRERRPAGRAKVGEN